MVSNTTSAAQVVQKAVTKTSHAQIFQLVKTQRFSGTRAQSTWKCHSITCRWASGRSAHLSTTSRTLRDQIQSPRARCPKLADRLRSRPLSSRDFPIRLTLKTIVRITSSSTRRPKWVSRASIQCVRTQPPRAACLKRSKRKTSCSKI